MTLPNFILSVPSNKSSTDTDFSNSIHIWRYYYSDRYDECAIENEIELSVIL